MSQATDRERVLFIEMQRRQTAALESIAETLIELLIVIRDREVGEEGNAV